MTNVRNKRSIVRQLFEFRSEPAPAWWWPLAIIVVLAYAVIIGYEKKDNIAKAVASGGSVLVGGLGVIFALSWMRRGVVRWVLRRKLGKLASETRAIQANDSIAAFMRIFKRSLLEPSNLMTLDEHYEFQRERDIFKDRSLQDQLGELYNKSIRMWSQGEGNQRFQRVLWPDGKVEDFFNPLRVVALFLTEDELLICDSEIDSLDESLKERITRTMIKDIVSITFRANRARFSMPVEEIVRLAEELGYARGELGAIRRDLNERSWKDPKYLQETVSAWLEITRTDGEGLSFPIWSRIYFGKRHSVDDGNSLGEDDQTIDRMMNELNRVVRSSKGYPPAQNHSPKVR